MSVVQFASTKIRIFVSNDDGIEAPGLQALVEGINQVKSYDVRVGAPDSEKSGSSHAFASSARVKKYFNGNLIGLPETVQAFSTSGYPANAVALGLLHNMFGDEWKPDLVISGVNRGANAGRNLVTSGTVGAAREAIFNNVKSLAVSMHVHRGGGRTKDDYKHGVQMLLPIIEWYIQETMWPTSILLNINIPLRTNPFENPFAQTSDSDGAKALAVVPQGESTLMVMTHRMDDGNNKEDDHTGEYKFRWTVQLDPDGSIYTDDIVAVQNGYYVMTPVRAYGSDDSIQKARVILEGWKSKYKHPLLEWLQSPEKEEDC